MDEFTENSQQSETASHSARRTFIKQMMFLSLAASLPSTFYCRRKEEAAAEDYLGTGLSPYKVWEEMLMALETSSDHLEGRYKRLIAADDPKAMFDFVRDEIYLMPNNPLNLSGMQTSMRYGIKGALRYGFATPREKAELLNEMYTKAEIPSKVVYEIANIPKEKVPAFFYRPIERNFDPLIDKETWNRWSQELEHKEDDEELQTIDSDLAMSQKLAADLWRNFPDKDKIRPDSFSFTWDNYLGGTPTVEFEFEGDTLYAHLFDSEVPFGRSWHPENPKIKEAKAPVYNEEKVSIP